MRITQGLVNYNLKRNLGKSMEDLYQTQGQISSGTKLSKLSDSPDDLAIAMNIQTTLDKQEQYKKNIEGELAWLGQNETALTTAADIMLRAKEISIYTGDPGVGEIEMSSMSMEIDELLDQTMNCANAMLGQIHIFSGYQMNNKVVVSNDTKVPTDLFPPDQAGINTTQPQTFMWQFNDPNKGDSQAAYKIEVYDAAGNLVKDTDWQDSADNTYTFPADTFQQGTSYRWRVTTKDQAGAEAASDWINFSAGAVNTYTDPPAYTNPAEADNAQVIGDKWYYSNNDDVIREIGSGMTVQINMSGKVLSDSIKILSDLKNALDAGDKETAMGLLGEIDDTHTELVQQRTIVGAKTKRLEDLQVQMDYQEVDLEKFLSDASGVSIEEASVSLANLLLAYQSSLAVSSKLLQTNILDYLK